MARVLIIDDNDQVREKLREVLEYAGHEVVEASDGKDGMRFFQKDQTELVITDVLMPEKDGLETIMGLRRDFPDVKIIAISGGGRIGPDNYLRTAKLLGAQYTFTKPFKLKELLGAVRDLTGPVLNKHV